MRHWLVKSYVTIIVEACMLVELIFHDQQGKRNLVFDKITCNFAYFSIIECAVDQKYNFYIMLSQLQQLQIFIQVECMRK